MEWRANEVFNVGTKKKKQGPWVGLEKITNVRILILIYFSFNFLKSIPTKEKL